MNPVTPAPGDFKPGLAIGGGILAGMLTVAVISAIFLVGGDSGASAGQDTGGSRQPGAIVTASDLAIGDCVNPRTGSSASQWQLADCTTPHQAQVSEILAFSDGDGAFPGEAALIDWLGDRCTAAGEAYLDSPVLDTTLAARSSTPGAAAWAAGSTETVCSVQQLDASPLDRSVEGAGSDFPRPDAVPVSRLKVGDCFVPDDGVNAYDLNSNSLALLVPCDGEHNGVFFGRANLDFAADDPFPGQDQVGTATSDLCASLFQEAYDVEAEGFNYRYWRPNETSWDRGDRGVLCAVLDAVPLTSEFDPSQHARFFDLATGECFNLGPEETSESLRLDDQVRVTQCPEAHLGQMIGSGNLDVGAGESFQGEEAVLELAAAECEALFTDFVGISPFESEFRLSSPIWYPNEQGWNDGDRRFACAYLASEPRTDSLEGAAR
ncbi:MAG: septum formation family protein [Actinomycetota bacterium]